MHDLIIQKSDNESDDVHKRGFKMEITEKKKVIRNTNYDAQFSYIILITFLIHIA